MYVMSGLAQFYFDGDRRPRYHHPVNADIPNKESFLRQVQDERNKRKYERLQIEASVRIQSWYRMCCIRREQKEVWRKEFDMLSAVCAKTEADSLVQFESLLHLFVMFCDLKSDEQRLLLLCKSTLKLYRVALQLRQLRFAWSRFLFCCVRYLEYISDQSATSFALPMRVIEVCTEVDVTAPIADGDDKVNVLGKIMHYSVSRGYFLSLRKLLEARVPDGLLYSTVPPTPLAGSILDVVCRVIRLACVQRDSIMRQLFLCHFCRELFNSPLSNQMQNFLIPAIAAWPFFPFAQFLVDLAECNMFESSLVPTANLLYSVLNVVSAQPLGELEKHSTNLVSVLELLVPTLQPLILPMDVGNATSSNAEDDAATFASPMEVDSSPGDVVDYCLEAFNQDNLVQVMVSSVGQRDMALARKICRICYTLFAARRQPLQRCRLLYSLSFKPWFLRNLWKSINDYSVSSYAGGRRPMLENLQQGVPLPSEDKDHLVSQLFVFCALFANMLMTVHDAEFYDDQSATGNSPVPFTKQELANACAQLRDVALGLIRVALPDARPALSGLYEHALNTENTSVKETKEWNQLFEAVVHLLELLHQRDVRLRFCPAGHWTSKELISLVDQQHQKLFRRSRMPRSSQLFSVVRAMSRQELENEGPAMSASDSRQLTILRKMPYVVPFEQRVKMLHSLIEYDLQENSASTQRSVHGWDSYFGPSIHLHVRRNYLYEDSFDKLTRENEPNLRLPIKVAMANWQGLDEAGIDGGGLFREFLGELLKTGFDPTRGFFAATPNENLLYPNPLAPKLFPDDFHKHYYFLGRMLGKLIYENLLAELPFAGFFLSKLLSKHSWDVDIHHLASLDNVLYNNLLYLKSYEGDVQDLQLDFSVIVEELGEIRKVDLKPDGQSIRVTAANRIEYIHLMADYYLNKQIRTQTAHFREGLSDLLDLDWLGMFDYRELQVLVAGTDREIDLVDMRNNTVYSGGYADTHPCIDMFWRTMHGFTDAQRRKLLKFVTSCSRPPLLGFKDLFPPFNIQLVRERNHLPTASTCMNLLKLPEFKEETVLRQKLLYAIESGAGFELS